MNELKRLAINDVLLNSYIFQATLVVFAVFLVVSAMGSPIAEPGFGHGGFGHGGFGHGGFGHGGFRHGGFGPGGFGHGGFGHGGFGHGGYGR